MEYQEVLSLVSEQFSLERRISSHILALIDKKELKVGETFLLFFFLRTRYHICAHRGSFRL